jgi:hypothetical protein
MPTKTTVVVAALLALSTSPAAMAQSVPKAPCAILKPAEVQALVPAAKPSEGVAGTLQPLGTATCTYKWAGSKLKLDVSVTEAAKAWPGHDYKTIQQGMQMMPRTDKKYSTIPGVGDAANFEARGEYAIGAVALVKGLMLTLNLDGAGAPAHKEQLILLLKAAAPRL